jgi:hypothetical protein
MDESDERVLYRFQFWVLSARTGTIYYLFQAHVSPAFYLGVSYLPWEPCSFTRKFFDFRLLTDAFGYSPVLQE